jgi:acylphosphatase
LPRTPGFGEKKRCATWYGYGLISAPDAKRKIDRRSARQEKLVKRCRMHIYYSGHVQGVGFRYTAKNVAMGYEVTGLVRNLPDGRVELIAEGQREELQSFQQEIRDSGLGSLISGEQCTWEDAKGEFRGFEISG